MFKSIIPGLVSFDTKLRKIPGMYVSSDFDFYLPTEKKHIFHFNISRKEIKQDGKFDFKDGYFLRSQQRWRYFRNLLMFKLAFEYVESSFSFTKEYSMIPFQLGSILPVGQIISDFIFLKMFLNGYLFFKGCSVISNKSVVMVIASPKMNGKTTFVKDRLSQGYSLISEDLVIIDPQKKIIFPFAPFFNNYGRLPNRQLKNELEKRSVVTEPKFFSKICLLENKNTMNKEKNKSELSDFIKLNVLLLCKNPFVLDYLYKENLINPFINKVNSLTNTSIPFYFYEINDYNYPKIL